MCGLAGVIGLNGQSVQAAVVAKMADALRHRGPDDDGYYVHGPVGFGFRRLAILDLSPSGHQPMVSADGRYVIVYNGEIYNYVELRHELAAKGYEFRSTGDTEVLLNAYAAWGKDCLQKLNGMWAFLIYDTQRRIIFGSRDRFGVKPLYRYQSDDVVLFGSEIKAISGSEYYSSGINWRTVSKFLIEHNLDSSTETFYPGVTQVAAGTAFELTLEGRWAEWRYWSLADLPATETGDPPARFFELFEDAVRLRLRSDVPVGVSLSGGLDSTSIICSMARLNGASGTAPAGALNAFAYMTPEFDESRYIRDTLQQTQAALTPVDINAGLLLDRLGECLWYYDEPVYSMYALIGFQIMEAAAKSGVKVMLGGQAADETIAGYFTYFLNYWTTVAAAEGLGRAKQEIDAFTQVHGGKSSQRLRQVLGRLLRIQLRQLSAYRAASRWRRSQTLKRNSWFTRDLIDSLPAEELGEDQTLDGALKFSIERSNLPLYLRIEDRNSMAHSIEMRLPFMDYRLVSYALQLPAAWKMRGPWNKYILREAMRGKIPESVRSRPDKMGFPFPGEKWLEEGLRKRLLELLSDRATRERGIYNFAGIHRQLEQAGPGGPDISHIVFNVIQFELWCRQPGCRSNAA